MVRTQSGGPPGVTGWNSIDTRDTIWSWPNPSVPTL